MPDKTLEIGKIVKMLLDEANDFSCATANDVALKCFTYRILLKYLKAFFLLKYMLFWFATFEIPSWDIAFKILFYER